MENPSLEKGKIHLDDLRHEMIATVVEKFPWFTPKIGKRKYWKYEVSKLFGKTNGFVEVVLWWTRVLMRLLRKFVSLSTLDRFFASSYKYTLRKKERKKCMANREQCKWVWRLKIPQRCKIFVWLALNDTLPTITPHIVSSQCPFCHGHDTLLHVLRDCPRSTTVWVHLVAPQHQRHFFSCSMWDWMVTYLQQPWSIVDSDNKDDAVLFAATVWLLWKDRKSWVCDQLSFRSQRVVHRVGALADDYGRVVEMEHTASTPAVHYVSRCFYWNQPPSQLQLRSVADTSNVLSPKL